MDYAVIMAGGTGKRLWPLSRRGRPKQILRLLQGQTLLGQCFARLRPIFELERILVLTNQAYVEQVRAELTDLPAENVVAEPVVRDTAGAIGLAATLIAARDPQASMAVLTADQIIQPAEALQGALRDALRFVADRPEALVTFGIQPTAPSTQYGYIQCRAPETHPGCSRPLHPVGAFREKPDLATARSYCESGEYAWNAGMFVWRVGRILEHLHDFLPACREPLAAIGAAWDGPDRQAALQRHFAALPRISIDFAVMERAPDVYTIRLDCQWLDLGSFPALRQVLEADDQGNVVTGGTGCRIDSQRNVVVTEVGGHLIALIGVNDLVVAHSPDATLVCAVDQVDRLKELLDRLEAEGHAAVL